jgi:hypothetical protein
MGLDKTRAICTRTSAISKSEPVNDARKEGQGA